MNDNQSNKKSGEKHDACIQVTVNNTRESFVNGGVRNKVAVASAELLTRQ